MLKSRKKAILRFFSAFLILIVLLGAFYYLTLALSIRNMLIGFRRAVVSGDVSGVLHYIDLEAVPKIVLPLGVIGLMPDAKEKSKKYLTHVIEYFFDVDLEEYLRVLSQFRSPKSFFMAGMEPMFCQC